MSRGFRDSDSTQQLTEQATAGKIEVILKQDREQMARSAEQLARGAYGSCEDCRGPIGEERLAVLPSSTRCVVCQAAWEQAN